MKKHGKYLGVFGTKRNHHIFVVFLKIKSVITVEHYIDVNVVACLETVSFCFFLKVKYV